MVSLEIFLLFAVTFFSLLLGVFVLWKHPRSRVNIAYFFLALGIALWALTNAVFQLSVSYQVAYWSALIAYYAGALLSVSFFYFTLVFPSGYSNLRRFHTIGIAVWSIVWLLVISIPNLTLKGVVLEGPVKGLVTGPGLYLYFFSAAVFLFGGMINLVIKSRKVGGLLRLQILYVLWGIFTLALFGIIFNVIFPLLNNYSLVDIGPSFSLVLLGSTAYAIVKHQLLGIREVLQRGTVYTILLVLVVGVYIGIVFALNETLTRHAFITPLLGGALVAMVGALGVSALERYFQKITDRWFYKDTYNYPAALYELSQVLSQNIELRPLQELIEQRLQAILKNEFVRLHFGSKKPENQGVLSKEIKFGNKTVAYLVLGKKLSGDTYRQTDFQLLETFANQAAVALEKARLYEEVRNYSVKLEQRVRERTEELDLLQEQQTHMVVDISHALQTPLTVMKSRLDSLQKKLPDNSDIAALGKTIDEVSKRTYDLLKLATWDTQEESFIMAPTSLSLLLEEMAEYLGVLCEEKGIAFRSRIEEGVLVLGDVRKLEELVNNLMSNAVKYIANERVITVTLTKKGEEAELVVTDTGIGIPPELLARVFERFYRVPSSSWTSGVGVGLAISKKIAERHHGSIAVHSTVGAGSSFVVRLPLFSGSQGFSV